MDPGSYLRLSIIFNSVLVYCLPLFGGCDAYLKKQLQTLQNKAAQVVCNAPPRANRCLLLSRVKWLTVNQLAVYHTLIAVYKIRTSKEPENLAALLSNETRERRIRRSNAKLSLAMKSFTFRGASLWNDLPSHIRKSENFMFFKREVRNWVLENVTPFIDQNVG